MLSVVDLLACPRCGGKLRTDWQCSSCDARYAAADGIPALREPSDERTETVRRFYERAPFPGYPPRDSLSSLRARAERSDFARRLDQAVAGDARVVEIGCGTGQMSLYLARADRVVLGVDLTRAALQLGAAAAQRYGVGNIAFVESDLRRPGLRRAAFDVVYSSGVLHHTPDPRAAFASIAALAKPGGMIVLGLYNSYARVPLRLRRVVAKASRYRWIPFDPVLRDRRTEPERREAWLQDQYQHPEEHRHTLREVQRWFASNEIDYVRTYPSTVFGEDSSGLFETASDNWSAEALFAQMSWAWTLGHEGGLFVVVGRRRGALTLPSLASGRG